MVLQTGNAGLQALACLMFRQVWLFTGWEVCCVEKAGLLWVMQVLDLLTGLAVYAV